MAFSTDGNKNLWIRSLVNQDRFEWDRRAIKDHILRLLDDTHSDEFQIIFMAVLTYDRVQPFQMFLECGLIEYAKTNEESILYKIIQHRAHKCLKAFIRHLEIEDAVSSILQLHQNVTAIHLSAQIGVPKILKVLLETVKDEINDLMSDVYQRSPLHYAAVSGSRQCVEECLDFGFAVDKKDKFHQTPLMFGVSKAQSDVVKLLVQKKPASVSVRNKFNGMSVLHLAILANNVDGLKVILEFAPKQLLDQLDESTRTPLHYAALYDRKECVELLLKHGANKNVTDKNYAYPAHYAAQHSLGSLKLLTQGIKEDFRDDKGRTTFMWAVLAQNEEIVKAYLNREITINVDPNSSDFYKKTALHLAAHKGSFQICKQLINADRPWSIQQEDFKMATSVHLAAGGGHNHLLELFRLSANIDIQNSEKTTPLFYACLGGMSHTVQVLVEIYGANVNHRNNIDQTPLHCAVFSGSLPCVKTLLDLNADLYAKNIKQKTPMDLAEELNHKLISEHFMQRLKSQGADVI